MEVDPFPFTADIRMQDAMLYTLKIEHIFLPKDITLDSIKSFDISLDGFEVVVQANLWLTENHNDGI